MGWHRSTLLVVVLGAAACRGRESFVATPTSVDLNTATLDFHALGGTRQLVPTVRDQRGDPIAGSTVQWSSDAPGIASVDGSGLVTAHAVGATQVHATVVLSSSSLEAHAAITVAQVPALLLKVAGDSQTGTTAGTLPTALAVVVTDSLGSGVPGVTVSFAVTQGGGSLSASSAVTDVAGQASVQWTLGAAPGPNAASATFPGPGIGGSPATFTASGVVAGTQPSVAALAGQGQTGLAGYALNIPPAVQLRDAGGAPLTGRTVAFAVTGGGGSVQGSSAVTDANGVAAVGAWSVNVGSNALTATVQGLSGVLGNPVTFTATGASPAYQIELRFVVPTTPARQAAFTAAAAKWESLIYGDVPDVALNRSSGCSVTSQVNTVDDILIFAVLDAIDGPGKILGQAGPCVTRSGSHLPVVGIMEFDTADVASLEASGQFALVIEHEMGHVLGYGTIWGNLLVDPASANPSADPHFVGTQALAAFDRSGGSTYTASAKVPVENTGGAGTIDAHWRESVFTNELMTGFINRGANPLSVVTTASMGDLGYQVNYAASDPFVLAVAPFPAAAQTGPVFRLGDDIRHMPIEVVNAAGRTVGMIPAR